MACNKLLGEGRASRTCRASSKEERSGQATSRRTERFADLPEKPDALREVGGRILGNTEAVASVLYRDYLLPFEVASVFLLVAMIGAVVLGKRSLERMD